jgi:ribulose-5-phosphate 4-epimerase/fuculose-1-phosphate aldolase
MCEYTDFPRQLKRKLITANHILDYQDIVDAYGHVSVRHPQNPEVYIMSGYMAPAIVKSSDDLIEYWVKDSSTVDKNAGKGYSERFIHGEMFRMYPEVNCVIHSHSDAVLPYVAATEVPMIAVYHMAGFLGELILNVAESCRGIDHF